jgi:hypothetical protein
VFCSALSQRFEVEDGMAELLFISHETPDGRTGVLNRALINAHTLKRNRKLRIRHRVQIDEEPHLSVLVASGKLPGQLRDEARTYDRNSRDGIIADGATTLGKVNDAATLQLAPVRLLNPSPMVAMPTGPIILGQDGEDIHNICKWYFLNQLHERNASSFRHVHDHWTNGLWEMARVNQPMFAAIAAFAFYKEIALSKTSSCSVYIKQKGRTMSQISKGLSRWYEMPDPLTLVAVALLAYMDVRDSHFDNARTHLRAVCNLMNMADTPTYVWLYCVWIDLRYALLTARLPILPYYIPTSLRGDLHQPSDNTQIVQRASRNVSNCLQTTFFDYQIACELFKKLHTLCLCSDRLRDSETPPFGQIYDLEYSLRAIQSHAFQENLPCLVIAGVELTVWAAQLHVWMACRFWTPQRRETHLALVSRARVILDAFGDAMTTWAGSVNAESLLWVLFTMIATARINGHAHEARMLDLLHAILNRLGLRCRDDFSAKLREWPWLDDWHPTQITYIWTMLTERFDVLAVEVSNSCGATAPLVAKESERRLFLGGLEYFDSL